MRGPSTDAAVGCRTDPSRERSKPVARCSEAISRRSSAQRSPISRTRGAANSLAKRAGPSTDSWTESRRCTSAPSRRSSAGKISQRLSAGTGGEDAARCSSSSDFSRATLPMRCPWLTAAFSRRSLSTSEVRYRRVPRGVRSGATAPWRRSHDRITSGERPVSREAALSG